MEPVNWLRLDDCFVYMAWSSRAIRRKMMRSVDDVLTLTDEHRESLHAGFIFGCERLSERFEEKSG